MLDMIERLMEILISDVRHSVRLFARSPGFTVAAIATLALGIGANVAVFSVVNTVLLKPVPYLDPDQLVVFGTIFPAGPNYVTSDGKFNLWRQQTSMVQDVAGYRYAPANLTDVATPQQVQGALVTADYFRLLGLPLARGRSFTPEDVRSGAPLAVLSDAFWQRAFAGVPQILGGRISLNGVPHEVIGVVAPGVETTAPQPIDVWTPLAIDPASANQIHYFSALGRLKLGVTLEMANAQLRLVADEFRRRYPNAAAMGPQATFGVTPMRDGLVGEVRPSLLVLSGAVLFVLLIACANVANLLLVRAAGRRREVAIRSAIGAARGRITRQLLTESALISTVGGTLGLLLGVAGIRVLLSLNPGNIPRIGEYGSAVTTDWRVFAFTALVSLTTTVVFGLAPALQASRTDLTTALKDGSARTGGGRRRNRTGALLVISEVALAVILMMGAALLIRTFIALRSVDPGIDVDNVLTFRMSLAAPRFEKTESVDRLIHDAVARINALPGVVASGYTSYVPLEGGATVPYVIDGRPLERAPYHGFGPWTSVSRGYFDVFRIPLVRGRLFTERDSAGAPAVVIINQALARRSWPEGDPLNARIFIGKGAGPEFDAEPVRQIVGIVGDVHDGPLSRPAAPTMYVPAAQLTDRLSARFVRGAMAWAVRTRVEPHSLVPAIERELQKASGGLPVARIRSMDQLLAQSTARTDFNMSLFTVFGFAALLLATIGIYGVMAYAVQQRAYEIGVRLALGADGRVVRNMMALQGMRLTLVGLFVGIVSSFGLVRFIAGFLFGVQARDPLVFTTVPAILCGVTVMAVWIPSLRASRIDPVSALRSE